MKKTLLLTFLSAAVLAGAFSCSHSKKEALNGLCNASGSSYSAHILPVLQNSCYSCHSAANADAQGSRRILEGHANVLIYVQNGLLMSAIRHEAPASFMPKNGPMLDDCTIARFQAWVDAGAPNN
ncbi:hypothetical protein [Flaviaesturariibacter aridisoli]|uniref:Cytochrome c domain-containing protein n=1 Tax=Flaviaesturariibacter aridisoli TaxID=2545761 RepID=A0A4R4E6Q2_9BACT|nr:hypothetical protein [Flaviaesturariibacter aridisoli]TCZ74470.1 hypothetical protein E0486_02260 [Flaviaesturariibacter aridisoli]